jgi:hypothetical protein
LAILAAFVSSVFTRRSMWVRETVSGGAVAIWLNPGSLLALPLGSTELAPDKVVE